MRRQFKDTLLSIAEQDERLVLLFGDISVFLFKEFEARFPGRFYNIGICEATLISMAAGLSSQGFIPVVHSIAPFITERAMEQIKIDLCYNAFHANIVSCGATFDYAWDGATHHAWTDMAFLRLLPGTQVFQPGCREEADYLLRTYYGSGKTSYFRLSDYGHAQKLPLQGTRGVVLRDTGSRKTVVTAGPILENVIAACQNLDANILYYHTLKPFDHELISRYAGTDIRVVHDSFGLFEAVCEVAGRSLKKLGLPDRFCQTYGTVLDARRDAGLDAGSIRAFLLQD
jgi:transketolase